MKERPVAFAPPAPAMGSGEMEAGPATRASVDFRGSQSCEVVAAMNELAGTSAPTE